MLTSALTGHASLGYRQAVFHLLGWGAGKGLAVPAPVRVFASDEGHAA
jgi:hypothetical protein